MIGPEDRSQIVPRTTGKNDSDPQRDARRRLALHVEHPPADDLLRPQRDVGDGRVGVGVELGPADAVSRRHRGDDEPRMCRAEVVRGISIRKRPEPSQRPS